GAISARLYRPAGPVDRAAVLTPGVHAMGIDEPRLQRLAGELAASGIAVLTIALPDLVRYRFSLDAVDQIEDAAIWLSAHDDLAPDGRVGLMGVSFAGGLTVVAAGRPGLRDRVAFTFSFGGHGDLPRTLRYLCTGVEPPGPGDPAPVRTVRPPHDYGVAVILLSLADRMVPPDQVEALRSGIETFLTASQLTLVDMALAMATFERSREVAGMLPEPSATLLRLVNERNTAELGRRLLPVLDDVTFPPGLSPEQSPPPPSPVYLLHGLDDTVIPAVETRLLEAYLRARDVEVRALLSALITHAELDRPPSFGDAWRLVSFWADLLRQ
ncbi:MAG TPA: hypothetical protein VIL25_10865, partial [Vicinamibacterales bacterium]